MSYSGRTVAAWSAQLLALALGLGADLSQVRAAFPEEWTVEKLTQRALAENAELRYFEAELAVAKGQRTQAGLWNNPEFSGEYGSRRVTDNTGLLQGDGYTRSFSVVQTFEFPGKASLRKAIADKEKEIAELGVKQYRVALAGKIRSLALQYVTASANVQAAEEINERSAELIRLLRERPTAGAGQLLERRVIEGSSAELQRSLREFTGEREEARIELNTLLGWSASHPLKIKIDTEFPKARLKSDALVLAGLKNNLQLKVRIAELEKAMKQVSAAKWEVAPDFSVGPFFSQDKAGDLEENVGATVSVTLPLWNWNQGNIAVARARKEQADALLLEARRKVEGEILRRVRAYELVQKQLEQTPRETADDLKESADLADRQYRVGGIGVQLFLEVQRSYLQSQQTRNEALLEAWRNLLDLELLTGGLPEENSVESGLVQTGKGENK